MLVDRNLHRAYKAILLKTSDTTFQVPRLDVVTHAIATIGYAHYAIHSGNHFETHHLLTGKNDGTWLTIYLKTPNTPKLIHIIAKWQSSGAAYFRIREGAVVTVNTGATGPIFNRKRGSSNTSDVFDNATAPVQGKVMTDVTIANRTPATAGVNGGLIIFQEFDGIGKQVPGIKRGDSERVLMRNMGYVFEVESDAAGLILSLQLDYYEIIPKSP